MADEEAVKQRKAACAAAAAAVATSSPEAAFPVHVAVWDDDPVALSEALAAGAEVDAIDPRGHTPLLLALKLERMRMIEALVDAGASAMARDMDGFTAFQEAIHPPGRQGIEAHQAVVKRLLAQTWTRTEARMSDLLAQLEGIPDVDMTIHWQFSSWVPLVSRVLPSDEVRVRKRGSSLRVDSSLRSFKAEHLEWQRGAISAVLVGRGEEGAGQLHLLDHVEKAEGCLRDRFRAPSSQMLTLATLQARKAEYVAASRPKLLGATAEPVLDRLGKPARVDAGDHWKGCQAFELRGARVAICLKHNPGASRLREDVLLSPPSTSRTSPLTLQASLDASSDSRGGGSPTCLARDVSRSTEGGATLAAASEEGREEACGEAGDEMAAVASRLLTADSRLRPVKEALRALFSPPGAMGAGRGLADEVLLDDTRSERVIVPAGQRVALEVLVPESPAHVLRFHFCSEHHDLTYHIAFRPTSALQPATAAPGRSSTTTTTNLATGGGCCGGAHGTGAASAGSNDAGEPVSPPPLGDRQQRGSVTVIRWPGKLRAAFDSQEEEEEEEGEELAFWTPSDLDAGPNGAAPQAVSSASLSSGVWTPAEQGGEAKATEQANAAAHAPGVAVMQGEIVLSEPRRVDAHVHAVRGRQLLPEGGGRAVLVFDNEASWMRPRVVRWRLEVVALHLDGGLSQAANTLPTASPSLGLPPPRAASSTATPAQHQGRAPFPPGAAVEGAQVPGAPPSGGPSTRVRPSDGGMAAASWWTRALQHVPAVPAPREVRAAHTAEAGGGSRQSGDGEDGMGGAAPAPIKAPAAPAPPPPPLAVPSAVPNATPSQHEGGHDEDAQQQLALLPFDEYFGVAPGACKGRHRDGAFRRTAATASERDVGAIALAMTQDFPLTLAQMLPLARALAASSRQHESLAAFFEHKLPPGFPVQFTLPVFPAVSAKVTFGRARVWPRGEGGEAHPDAPPEHIFRIPEDYERGAYRNFSERFLDG